MPFSGFQRAEPFCGYEVEKKSGQTSIVLEIGYKFWGGEFTHILLAFLLPENGFPEAKKAIFEMAQRYANLPFHVKTAFVDWLFGSLWLTADGIA